MTILLKNPTIQKEIMDETEVSTSGAETVSAGNNDSSGIVAVSGASGSNSQSISLGGVSTPTPAPIISTQNDFIIVLIILAVGAGLISKI